MEQSTAIYNFKDAINGMSTDIKAEALVLLALNAGLDPDDFLISCDALFSREYSKDIAAVEIKQDVQKKQWLHLHLSRTGLYDQLPERLFFQDDNSDINNVDPGAAYRANKKKEEEIRKFFLPFENDFFLQRLHIEEHETQMFEGLKTGLFNDYFEQFWDLPPALPTAFAAPLVLLIPYAHEITGNLELTAGCLEHLLKEHVVISKTTHSFSQGIESPGLGELILGQDSICGNSFYEDSILLKYSIGPLKNSEIIDYLEHGLRTLVIETFNRFFVPAGTLVEVLVNVAPERQHMVLDKYDAPVLGYSGVLGKTFELSAGRL